MLKFSLIKFITLSITALRSIMLATFFGPSSYGIFGTLIVIQQYMSFSALGMREAITVELAKEQSDEYHRKQVFISGISWGTFVGLFVFVILIMIGHFIQSGMYIYFKWIGLVAFLSIINEILININRDQENYTKIASLEVLYSGFILSTIFYYGKYVTINNVLIAMAIALLFSLSVYIYTLKLTFDIYPSIKLINNLIKRGIPLALMSFLGIILNSFFIIISNIKNGNEIIGLVVFANNIVAISLFGLKSIQWAMMSRSMQKLNMHQDLTVSDEYLDKLLIYFYFYILILIPLLLCIEIIIKVYFVSYAGAGELAFYIFLFQSSLVLVYEEINYNVVNNHSRNIIYGFISIVLFVAFQSYYNSDLTIVQLIIIGIIAFFIFSAIILYNRYKKAKPDFLLIFKKVYLFFPMSIAIINYNYGSTYVLLICLGFLVFTIKNRPIKFASI